MDPAAWFEGKTCGLDYHDALSSAADSAQRSSIRFASGKSQKNTDGALVKGVRVCWDDGGRPVQTAAGFEAPVAGLMADPNAVC